jgi:hypothetical protein
MAVGQRPVTEGALFEPLAGHRCGGPPELVRVRELDRNIPAGAHRIMAERAGGRASWRSAAHRTSWASRTRGGRGLVREAAAYRAGAMG